MTANGVCKHKSGEFPFECLRNGTSSQSLCEEYCTSWTSCIAFVSKTLTKPFTELKLKRNLWKLSCSLITQDRSCPSGFRPIFMDLRISGPIAASKNDLVAFEFPIGKIPGFGFDYACYGRNY